MNCCVVVKIGDVGFFLLIWLSKDWGRFIDLFMRIRERLLIREKLIYINILMIEIMKDNYLIFIF